MDTIAIARAFYDAIARLDVAGVVASLHPHVIWTEAEGFPYYSGSWHSPQEVVEKLLIPLGRDWDDFAATPHEFVVQGATVVSFGVYSGRAKATGKTLRAPFAHRWEIRDGKLARFDMYTDTLLVHRALH